VPTAPASPPLDESRRRLEAALPGALLALTFTTGVVDAASYLGLGHVFTANMTGNVVLLGFALAGASGFSAWPSLVALAAFFAGAHLGGRLKRAVSTQRRRWFGIALTGEVVLLLASSLLAIGLVPDGHNGRRFLVIALSSAAMGIRNATVRALGVTDLTTTVLTMTVTGLASDSIKTPAARRAAARRVGAVVAMLLGALVGALIERHSIAGAFGLSAAIAAVAGAVPVYLGR
jgi:uncharacterized membrane protein YoaK (UPF0700 family)